MHKPNQYKGKALKSSMSNKRNKSAVIKKSDESTEHNPRVANTPSTTIDKEIYTTDMDDLND